MKFFIVASFLSWNLWRCTAASIKTDRDIIGAIFYDHEIHDNVLLFYSEGNYIDHLDDYDSDTLPHLLCTQISAHTKRGWHYYY